MILLNTIGVLSVEGTDAQSFLQGQVTCQMQNVHHNQSSLAAHCNLKGRVESFFRILENGQTPGYLLLLNRSIQEKCLTNFKKYALFSKITLNTSPTLRVLGLIGNNSPQLLDGFFKTTHCSSLQNDQCYQIAYQEDHYVIVRISSSNRYQVIANQSAIDKLCKFLAPNMDITDESLWEQMEMEQGYPEIYPNTCGQFLPHHINLIPLNAVSFKKGCYLGQEIVNRMQFRGNIKKKLYYTKCHEAKSTIQPGDKLFAPQNDKEPIGEVVRSLVGSNGETFVQVILAQDIKLTLLETQWGVLEIL